MLYTSNKSRAASSKFSPRAATRSLMKRLTSKRHLERLALGTTRLGLKYNPSLAFSKNSATSRRNSPKSTAAGFGAANRPPLVKPRSAPSNC